VDCSGKISAIEVKSFNQDFSSVLVNISLMKNVSVLSQHSSDFPGFEIEILLELTLAVMTKISEA